MIQDTIAQSARQRTDDTLSQRNNVRRIAFANPASPWQAETDEARRDRFIARVHGGRESIQGDTTDFQPVAFLSEGFRISRAVALVNVDGPKHWAGTGFMISPSLFITNHHVIENLEQANVASLVFDYEYDDNGRRLAPTRFTLAPEICYLTVAEDDLDFTIVAVGGSIEGGASLADFGYCPLSDRDNKHALGMPVNIIQHPEALPKCIAIRNNLLAARIGRVLHYETDSEVGSSGSPVFNDAWDVIALHHWGEPFLERKGEEGQALPTHVNEGIRISKIIERIRAVLPDQIQSAQRLLQEALVLTPAEPLEDKRPVIHHGGTIISPSASVESYSNPFQEKPMANSSDTSNLVRLVVPLEITISLGQPGRFPSIISSPSQVVKAEKAFLDDNYGNRHGYDPEFISGYTIPMPEIAEGAGDIVAPLLGRGSKAIVGELLYEHFSLKLHRSRRMAIFTATNIDGTAYLAIDRDTGLPSANKEEGGERWFEDPRIDSRYFINQDFYSAWSNYFDRGHLTRRTDPTWGDEKEAVRANADTFHFTNCTPQHFRFNQSTKYWQGVERYVLEKGALGHQKKLCVFQGPVLNDEYADADQIQVPLKFWKIVVWEGKEGLKAAGFLVSQEKLLDEPRRQVGRPNDQTVIDVDQFRAPIVGIEKLTQLDFGDLRDHDTYKKPGAIGAEAMKPINCWEDLL